MKRTNFSSSLSKNKKITTKAMSVASNTIANKDMSVFLIIRNERIKIFCGSGTQNLLWLFNTAIRILDKNYAFKTGLIFGFYDNEGALIDSEFNLKIINKLLQIIKK